MNEELNKLVSLYGSQKMAAEAIGIRPVTLNHLLHRKRDFSARVLRRIKKVFPAVSIDALLEPGVIDENSK